MESRGKCRQDIGSGVGDITHHIHLNGPDLAQAQAHVRTGFAAQAAVNMGQALLQVFVGLVHRHSVQIKRAQNIHVDAPFGRNHAPQGGLVVAEDVYDNFISGAQAVIPGGGQILARSKIQGLVPENIAAEHRGILRHKRSDLLFIRRLALGHRVGAVYILHGRFGGVGIVPALVQGIYTLGLRAVHTAEGKLRYHGVAVFSFRHGLLDVFKDLGVCHGALCPGKGHKKDAGAECGDASSDKGHIL